MRPSSDIYTVYAAAISAASGIIGVALTVMWGKRRDRRGPPKDRAEVIFDGYDALLGQISNDLSRKDLIIKDIQAVSEAQAIQLQTAAKENARLHGVISDLQRQLKECLLQMESLKLQLDGLRGMV